MNHSLDQTAKHLRKKEHIHSVWPKTHKALIMSKKALKNAVNFG